MYVVYAFVFISVWTECYGVEFEIKDCNTGDGLTSESSHIVYRTNTSEYTRCRAISDMTLPQTVDYNITVELKSYQGSTPGVMFNIKDDSNYDMVYFRSNSYDCLLIASLVDGTFNKYTEYDKYCDGFLVDEGIWYQMSIKVLSNSFIVSIDEAFAKTYPAQLPQVPSVGVLQGLTFKESCKVDCKFSFRSIDVFPDTTPDIHVTEHGTLGTPDYQPNTLSFHQIDFHKLGRVRGTFCFVALYLKHIDIDPGMLYIEQDGVHEEGAVKMYITSGKDLKIYFYSSNMDSSSAGYTIEYHVFSCGVPDQDLSFVCTTGYHNTLSEDYFRSTAFSSDPNDYQSDSNTVMGWYSFSSCAGDSIPINPPKGADMCGTRDPVWLQAPLNGITDSGLSEVTACVYREDKECDEQWKIPVFGCGGFFLYYLLPTPDMSGYCAGNRLFCDSSKNLTSEDGSGCDPCVDSILPEMTGVPSIKQWSAPNEKGLYALPCTIYGPENPKSQVVYQVEWVVNYGTHTIVVESVEETSQTTVKLQSNTLTNEHLQNHLVCRGRVRIQIGGNVRFGPWRESEPVFIGLKFIDTEKDVKQGDNSVDIRFVFTVPLTCNGNQCLDPSKQECFTEIYFLITTRDLTKQACINFLYREPELLHLGGCSIRVPCNSWNITQNHKIIAKDTKQSGVQPYTHILYAVTKDNRPTWNNLVSIAKVNIDIDNSVNVQSDVSCTSNNDPHLTTWKTVKYDVHLKGEFVLYQSKPEADPSMEVLVTAQYKPCDWNIIGLEEVTCNMAVGVRVKNEAIIIDAQQTGTKHKYIGSGFGENGFKLMTSTKYNMLTYTVALPRGETVTVALRKQYLNKNWINIAIMSSSADPQHTSQKSNGLCGKLNFPNKVKNKDLTWRDGKLYDIDLKGKYPQVPKEFAEDWRAWKNESLITKEYVPEFKASPGPASYACNVYELNDFLLSDENLIEQPVVVIEPCIPHSDFNLLRGLRKDAQSRKRRNLTPKKLHLSHTSTRTKRDTHSFAWTDETAHEYCMSYIEGSSIASTCNLITPGEVDIAVEQCALDIMLTNDTVWAKGTLTSLRELCTFALYQNLTLWTFEEDGNTTAFKPPAELTKNLCPDDCSMHGICVDGQCQCHEGYISFDCSLSVETPPTLSWIMGTICYTDKDCDEISVTGNDFAFGDGLTCHFVEIKDNAKKPFTGQMLSFDFVSCPIAHLGKSNEGYAKYSLSVSNDGIHTSDPVDVILVSASCVTCQQDDVDSEVTCALNVDTCLIDEQCVTKGEESSTDACQYCEPGLEKYQWSTTPDCGESGGLSPLQIGMTVLACTVVIAGVVIIAICISYRSKIRKALPSEDAPTQS